MVWLKLKPPKLPFMCAGDPLGRLFGQSAFDENLDQLVFLVLRRLEENLAPCPRADGHWHGKHWPSRGEHHVQQFVRWVVCWQSGGIYPPEADAGVDQSMGCRVVGCWREGERLDAILHRFKSQAASLDSSIG